ncbi:MAG: mycofactocin biosynthesis chaperone MftB [Acidimicrobiales bacterium]
MVAHGDCRPGTPDQALSIRLSPRVSFRRERFGALIYHRDTRRLVFLRSQRLVALLEVLGDFGSAQEAIEASAPVGEWDQLRRALSRLVDAGIVDAR